MIISAAIKDKNGQIYTGKRHHQIIKNMPQAMVNGSVQGFLTDDGKFVDRVQALKIALEYEQIKNPIRGILTSEDLW